MRDRKKSLKRWTNNVGAITSSGTLMSERDPVGRHFEGFAEDESVEGTALASRTKTTNVAPMNAALASELRQLTPVEKLRLVEDLWDEIAADEDRLPIPAWHAQVLAEDAADYQKNPTKGASWPEVKVRLRREPKSSG